ncbi:hypothetical protein TNCV_1438721 [Trichonephila clavipes]|nr:hypothetical protein TNCV_1438721 [Trichonephila clavipes]
MFNETGRVKNLSRNVRPTANEATVEHFRQSFQRSPVKSTCEASREAWHHHEHSLLLRSVGHGQHSGGILIRSEHFPVLGQQHQFSIFSGGKLDYSLQFIQCSHLTLRYVQ